ncbi:MAG: hypothetical protein H7062_20840 [Candidatus Saccharimonas sp.]|nr:hypothetical protein [Planctomycetaceae bacterium]
MRRAFATANAESMNLFALQSLMQHKSLETTKGYVNMARQLNRPVQNLFVPTLRRRGDGNDSDVTGEKQRLAK